MMFKGFGLGLFIVVAAVLMLGTLASDYQTFLRQHYDNPRSKVGNRYCNKMMQKRKMTKPCKEINTFVHDTTNNIVDVCGEGGEDFIKVDALGRRFVYRRSLNQFRVTTCTLRGSHTRPPCEYRENTSPRYIVIACENGFPVHYEEDQIQ